jgi:hypothetical protein
MGSLDDGPFLPLTDEDVEDLLTCLRQLVENCHLHNMDYHHVTPPGLLERARALLQRLEGHNSG